MRTWIEWFQLFAIAFVLACVIASSLIVIAYVVDRWLRENGYDR